MHSNLQASVRVECAFYTGQSLQYDYDSGGLERINQLRGINKNRPYYVRKLVREHQNSYYKWKHMCVVLLCPA
jgi:hypothetical protein